MLCPMDERIVPLTEILRLNTLLFRNCLARWSGISGLRCLDDVQQWPTLAETEAAWAHGGRARRPSRCHDRGLPPMQYPS
jgi:hypothetical protein